MNITNDIKHVTYLKSREDNGKGVRSPFGFCSDLWSTYFQNILITAAALKSIFHRIPGTPPPHL